ncbi:hypothetical protein MMC10_005436 [Thelotrema lepadinum]|nr:hypothetical protein [Thelotrema lepadinum]
MLDQNKKFIPLPKERILFTSPSTRTTLSLSTPNTYPGKSPLSLSSAAGTAYLTNRRILYLPLTPSSAPGGLSSFTCPLTHIHDAHVTAPFFGPNVWVAVVKPVPGGGLPEGHKWVEVKVTFRDGGAYDWQSCFEGVRESLVVERERAMTRASENGGGGSGGGAGGQGGGEEEVDWERVGGEGLPAYEDAGSTGSAVAVGAGVAASGEGDGRREAAAAPAGPGAGSAPLSRPREARTLVEAPNEPPPGYEEVQSSSVALSLEEGLRREAGAS